MASTGSQSKGNQCEDDRCSNLGLPVFYCVDCDTTYCEDCWKLQAPHKPGKVGRDGIEHERTNYQILQVYKKILHPPSSAEMLRRMHEHDSDTLWFGVTKDDETGEARFEDHGRYADLMTDSPSGLSTTKYPKLVSFVGVTNAGKSTIIKMLIDRQGWDGPLHTDQSSWSSPVVGSAVNDKVPTSGDVHLYPDPSTFNSEFPVLYADCEGLEGGEALPYGAQSRKRSSSVSKGKKRRPKVLEGRPRNLAWALDERTKKREYAVTELYPRLLYTFSDVIVFVLRNAKTFQSSVLSKLLEWGAASLEKSLNQPTLPHAVIVLNATDLGINEDEWSPQVATEKLLNTVRHGLDKFSGVPELRALADQWRETRNVDIQSVKDLILKYYSSFTVVRMPVKGRYTLMDEQARQLHATIEARCRESHKMKSRARMVSNSNDLNMYLQAAFDHFTLDLDKPFNFVEVSLKNNPLPETFTDHILQLAITIRNHWRDSQRTTLYWIFDLVGKIVASCLMVDAVRYRKGTGEDLFESYRAFLEDALFEFCDMHWPCTYVSRKGQQCALVRGRHSAKGHQIENGKIIGAGHYESNFSPEAYGDDWLLSVRKDLMELYKELQTREETSRMRPAIDHALEMHRDRMSKTFRPLDRNAPNKRHGSFLVSHATCLCCLREQPEHGLPCGHVFCSSCIRAYGSAASNSVVVVDSCPLHFNEPFLEPWRVIFKPEFAGVRVLSLDGGGIRGIVELVALRAIEQAIGHSLPIQAFFDLIVGTSTGGIIALAVGVKQWPIEKCLKTFLDLCDTAFTKRELAGVLGLEQLATLTHGSKYKTQPLRKALKETLGDAALFGGVRDRNPEHAIKVAVTATSATGRDALVISNYSRLQPKSESYDFVRSDHPDLEFKVDEAAAATAAAPGYFKPFFHERQKQYYLDGALYHNNPVLVANNERKLLWPDVAESGPDIHLSIGTGTNADIDKEVEGVQSPNEREHIMRALRKEDLGHHDQSSGRPRKYTLYKTFKALYKRFDNVLDAELAWKGFISSVPPNAWSRTDTLPYMRINPILGMQPPALDEKDKVDTLRERVVGRFYTAPLRNDVQRVAFQLIASTFYFSKRGYLATAEESVAQICKGRICCRFPNDSWYLRNLGNFLRFQQVARFSPYFAIAEHRRPADAKVIPITSQVIEAMINNATFDLGPMEIEIWNPVAPTNITIALRGEAIIDTLHYSISGFPRFLGVEDSNKLARQTSPEPSKSSTRRRSRRNPIRSPLDRAVAPDSFEDLSGKQHEDDFIKAHGRDTAAAEAATHSMSSWRAPPYNPNDALIDVAPSSSSGQSASQSQSQTTPSRETSVFELEGDSNLFMDSRSFEEDDEQGQFEADMQKAIRESLRPAETSEAEDKELNVVLELSKRHLMK